MEFSRRGLLGLFLAAPMVVPACRLMKLRGLVMPLQEPLTAFQLAYRREAIEGFEFGQSALRASITQEIVIDGRKALFVLAHPNGARLVA